MQLSFKPEGLQGWTGSALIVGFTEENLEIKQNLLEDFFKLSLDKFIALKDFKGKTGEKISFEVLSPNPRKVVLIGLGTEDQLDINELRKTTAKATRECLDFCGILGISLPWESFKEKPALKAVVEAIRLSHFKDIRFRSDPDPKKEPEKVEILGISNFNSEEINQVLPSCSGVELARELVGSPPNELTPDALAKSAQAIAKKHNLESKILGKEECKRLGMGAFLAVAQGSDLDAKFVHLTYKPKEQAKRKLVLIGKGLTFDSGGYNLKVGASQIDLMKFDMGGSAAVLGAARAIGELRPSKVEVHFIVATCENMINGSAVHPGDIVKASNGKTIEINNTDAEGRLTLADALVYASKLKPNAIVDLATLTGACVIALGDEIAGIWSDNDPLINDLISAANDSGEGLWRMPLRSSYREGLKSKLADIKNTGPRAGGSITAALFLKEFVEDSIPWAHIDIAGPVWSEKESGINPPGATGYGVRTLVNWVIAQSKLP